MNRLSRPFLLAPFLLAPFLLVLAARGAPDDPPEGFVSLFDGKDLRHWRIPENDGGHWRVVDGVIDYDARSEADGGNTGRSLWSRQSFGDFVLRIDWRLKTGGGLRHRVPRIEPDGTYRRDAEGEVVETVIDDVDSGIYLRGQPKAQVNLWCWPVGSGEIWGYRTDPSMPPAVRAACTPLERADRPRGEWNTFEIRMVGETVRVTLNGTVVIDGARLPGVAEEGPLALQHHGSRGPDGEWQASYGPLRWSGTPSLVQFRNIFIKELDGGGE